MMTSSTRITDDTPLFEACEQYVRVSSTDRQRRNPDPWEVLDALGVVESLIWQTFRKELDGLDWVPYRKTVTSQIYKCLQHWAGNAHGLIDSTEPTAAVQALGVSSFSVIGDYIDGFVRCIRERSILYFKPGSTLNAIESRPFEFVVTIPIPFGLLCSWCDEGFAPADTGVAISCMADYQSTIVYHRECEVRVLIGSVAHQKGECSCSGAARAAAGSTISASDDSDGSRRSDARAAYNHMREHGSRSR